jgi:hypothetical protein
MVYMLEKRCDDCQTALTIPLTVLVDVELDMRMRGDDGTAVFVCADCEAKIAKSEAGDNEEGI